MRVLVDIGHPAHVHFYRSAMAALRADGHDVVVTARDKDVALDLLRAFDIPHTVLGPRRAGRHREYVQRLASLVATARRLRPDVMTAVGGAFVAPAARLAGSRSVVFTDTEHVALDRFVTYPWATRICTPYTFKKDLPRAQVRYHGLHELAYLSPARFEPDAGVLDELGVRPDEPFAILRLVSWTASHDEGHRGLTPADRAAALEQLGRVGRVFVSFEGEMPAGLRAHRLQLPVHRIHHALAHARVYLGEGATMATEAGLLGTPSVYVSTLVGTMGNFDVLAEAGLVESHRDGAPAVAAAVRLMQDDGAGAEWRTRARRFADAHVDVVDLVRSQVVAVGAGC